MEFSAEQMLTILKKNSEVPNVLLVWGEENHYKDLLLQALTSATFSGNSAGEREVVVFDKDLSLLELESVVNTYPFFAKYNLIVIKEPKLLKIDKQKDSATRKEEVAKFTDIILNTPDFTRIICLLSNIDKRSKFYKSILNTCAVVESKSIKAYNLRPWLEQEAGRYGAKWSYEALECVMEYMSYTDNVPLILLAKEIEKLDVYAGNKKEWSKEDVESIFSELPEVSAFALNNAIAEQKIESVLTLLALEEKRGTNILKVAGIITSQLRRMLAIKELMNKGFDKAAIASSLKIHPFVVQKTMQQVKRFSILSLEKALVALAELNIELRSGGRKFDQLEEILLLLVQQA